METKPPSYSYAHAGDLIAGTLDAFLPPQRISTADFAATHRYLFNEGGGHVGLWTHDKAPYLVEIMDALDDTDHNTVVVPGPGQSGKTACAENWMFKLVCTDPGNLLWYMQVQAALEAYVKSTINPMIAGHAEMQERLGSARTDDSLKFKGFLGMQVQFLAATHSNVTNKNAGRIVADEYDGYSIGTSETGIADPKSLLDVRRSTYGRESKLLCISHPDRAGGSKPSNWNAGIMSLYRDSDRRTWWWPCPHCAMWSSPNPGTNHHTTLEYNDALPLEQIAASTHLVCPHNGCLIADSERRGMNLLGKWVGLGQTINPESGEISGDLLARDIAGFWIVGVMSPFVFGGIGGLATSLVKAQREYEQSGEVGSLRQVVVKQLGIGFDPPKTIGSVNAATLIERADASLLLRTVPQGVRFITAAIDVQANRFEALFRGWGIGRESWVIEHRVKNNVEPATDPVAWDEFLQEVAEAEFPLADGSGRILKVLGVGYDSAGAPGVTMQGMDAWRRARLGGRARSLGTIAGRPAYKLLPLKGGSAHGTRPLQVIRPDARSDRHSGARGDVPVGLFAPNYFKDALAGQLATAESGPGYIHFPAGLLAAVPPHPFFEQLVAEQRDKKGHWIKTSARNEALDLMVMTGVIAHLYAPSAFDWKRPPPWARDWSENPLVALPSSTSGVVRAAGAPLAQRPLARNASFDATAVVARPMPPHAAPSQTARPLNAAPADTPKRTFAERAAALAAARGSQSNASIRTQP